MMITISLALFRTRKELRRCFYLIACGAAGQQVAVACGDDDEPEMIDVKMMKMMRRGQEEWLPQTIFKYSRLITPVAMT